MVLYNVRANARIVYKASRIDLVYLLVKFRNFIKLSFVNIYSYGIIEQRIESIVFR